MLYNNKKKNNSFTKYEIKNECKIAIWTFRYNPDFYKSQIQIYNKCPIPKLHGYTDFGESPDFSPITLQQESPNLNV